LASPTWGWGGRAPGWRPSALWALRDHRNWIATQEEVRVAVEWLRLNPPAHPLPLETVKKLAAHGGGERDEKGRFIQDRPSTLGRGRTYWLGGSTWTVQVEMEALCDHRNWIATHIAFSESLRIAASPTPRRGRAREPGKVPDMATRPVRSARARPTGWRRLRGPWRCWVIAASSRSSARAAIVGLAAATASSWPSRLLVKHLGSPALPEDSVAAHQ
jgi:hypothetical protein